MLTVSRLTCNTDKFTFYDGFGEVVMMITCSKINGSGARQVYRHKQS